MEPVSLTVGAVVAALILKAADKTGEQMAAGGLTAIGRLVERVQGRLSHRGDVAAQEALARVQDPPAGPAHMAALAAAVDRHAIDDPEFAEELRRLVHEIEAAGVEVQRVTQVARGSRISQIQGVSGSNVTVNIGEPQEGKQHGQR